MKRLRKLIWLLKVQFQPRHNVDMPLVESVNQVLFENKPAKEAMRDIMKRDLTHEFPDLVWE
jgi:glycerol-3-phosphate dehydrogenase (NAD(P)+)